MCTAAILGLAPNTVFFAQVPILTIDLNLSAAQVGVIGGAYYAGYVLSVPLLVGLTDHLSAKHIYLGSACVGSLATLGFGLLASSASSASFFHGLMGVGLAGTYMPGLKLLTNRLEASNRHRAVGFYTVSYAVGISLSFVLVGQLAKLVSWQEIFYVTAMMSILGGILVGFAIPSEHRVEAPSVRLAQGFVAVLENKIVLSRSLAYAAHNFELFGLWSWIVAFLVFAYRLRPDDRFQIDPTIVAACITLLFVPASLAGNEIASKLGSRRWILIVMFVSAGIAFIFGFLPMGVPSSVLILVALLYGVTVAAESSVLTASVISVADSRLQGTTMAVYSVIGFAGSFASPLIFGLVLQIAGDRSVLGWGTAFAVMGLGALLGALSILLLEKNR